MKCTPDETGRCTTCGDMLSVPKKATDADRIAALEAELAEAQENERRINRERAALCTSLDQERAAHERTKAELVAEHADRLNIDEHRGRLLRERDAAQAQAAAMRMAGAKVYDALLGAESWINFDGPDGSDLCLCFPDWDPDTAPLPTKPEAHGIMCSHFRDAIYSWRSISTAGRALAARVPLWRELEKWCLQMQGHAKSPHLDHVLAKLAALDE
jgi:hypothetical protein